MPACPTPGGAEAGASRRRGRRRRGAAAIVLGLCCLAGDGGADVYRCEDASGRVTFTDDAAACERARRHELQSRLQRVPSAQEEVPAAPLPPADDLPMPPAGEDPRAEKAQWQQHKLRKEAELAALTQRLAKLERFVTSCNRGLEVVGRDATGIKTRLSCDWIRQEYEDTRTRSREVAEYLENGLEVECRRSGCLPGWIR